MHRAVGIHERRLRLRPGDSCQVTVRPPPLGGSHVAFQEVQRPRHGIPKNGPSGLLGKNLGPIGINFYAPE